MPGLFGGLRPGYMCTPPLLIAKTNTCALFRSSSSRSWAYLWLVIACGHLVMAGRLFNVVKSAQARSVANVGDFRPGSTSRALRRSEGLRISRHSTFPRNSHVIIIYGAM